MASQIRFLVNSFCFNLRFRGPLTEHHAIDHVSGFGPPCPIHPLQKAAFLATWAILAFLLWFQLFFLVSHLGISSYSAAFLFSVSNFCRSAGELYWFYINTLLWLTWLFIFRASFLRCLSQGCGGLTGFCWLVAGFFGAEGGSGRWRESHLTGKVLLLITPWRLFLSGWEIITTWLNSYVLFRTKQSLSFCMTQTPRCYLKYSFLEGQHPTPPELPQPLQPPFY